MSDIGGGGCEDERNVEDGTLLELYLGKVYVSTEFIHVLVTSDTVVVDIFTELEVVEMDGDNGFMCRVMGIMFLVIDGIGVVIVIL